MTRATTELSPFCGAKINVVRLSLRRPICAVLRSHQQLAACLAHGVAKRGDFANLVAFGAPTLGEFALAAGSDLRSQILGQLSERLNYDRLYQQAPSDPELKRTAVELEAVVERARGA